MKRTILPGLLIWLLISLFGQTSGFGQTQSEPPGNKISLSVLTPLNFQFETADDLLRQKIIKDALEVNLKIKQEDVIVFATAEIYGGAGNTLLANLLALRLANKTSANAVISGNEVPLSTSMVPLFTQPRSYNGVAHYSFLYDLILKPSKTIIPPGAYSFALNFTITPQ